MKKIIVPKGAIERHESIEAETLVIQGTLIVNGTIRCKQIYGNGTIQAEKIIAGAVKANIIDTTHIHAKKVIAGKVYCAAIKAPLGIVVKDYLEALHVRTTRLTITLSDIDKIEASEIIRLNPKNRSFVKTLLVSWIQQHFFIWRQYGITSKKEEADTTVMKSFSDLDERVLRDYEEKCATGKFRLILEAVE